MRKKSTRLPRGRESFPYSVADTTTTASRPRSVITCGRDAVVVVSANEYGKLSRPRGSLVDFFRKSPLAGVNLDLARSTDTGRRVDL